MTNFLRFFTLLIAISLVGCGATLPKVKPYKMDIQQGNVVTSEMLLKLRPGMTKSQVKFIMGTPLLVDSFRTNRWDYFYQLRKQGKIVTQRRVILDFEDDLLKGVRGDVVPKGKTVEDVTKELEKEAGVTPSPTESSTDETLAPVVTPPIDTPVIESSESAVEAEASEVESVAESASVLAVPLAVEPVLDAAEAVSADVLKEETPAEVPKPEVVEKEVAPVAMEEAKTGVLKEIQSPVTEVLPIKEQAEKILIVMPSKADPKRKVFILDRSLDTTRIIPTEVTTSDAVLEESVVKELKEDGDLPEDDGPSFFERALEKIGF